MRHGGKTHDLTQGVIVDFDPLNDTLVELQAKMFDAAFNALMMAKAIASTRRAKAIQTAINETDTA